MDNEPLARQGISSRVSKAGGEQQLVIELDQVGTPRHPQPGTLAKLCSTLKRAKVNIEAISVADSADCCCVRLIASPVNAAKAALTKAKFPLCTRSVLTVSAPNKPGELAAISAKLAKAGVNISYVYGSTSKREASVIVLAVDNLSKAERAIRR